MCEVVCKCGRNTRQLSTISFLLYRHVNSQATATINFQTKHTGKKKKIVFAQDNGFLLINWYQTRKQQSHLMSLYLHTQVSVPAARTNIRHKHHMYITHFCLVIFLHNYASLKRKFRASKQPAYMKHHAHSGNAMNWKMDASGTFKASFSMCQKSH